MSWAVSIAPTPAADLPVAIASAKLGEGFGPDFAREEAEAQLAAAKAAATALFASGAVGKVGEYVVTLSGHAEPGHERRVGYAGDTIHVSVSRYIDYSLL